MLWWRRAAPRCHCENYCNHSFTRRYSHRLLLQIGIWPQQPLLVKRVKETPNTWIPEKQIVWLKKEIKKGHFCCICISNDVNVLQMFSHAWTDRWSHSAAPITRHCEQGASQEINSYKQLLLTTKTALWVIYADSQSWPNSTFIVQRQLLVGVEFMMWRKSGTFKGSFIFLQVWMNVLVRRTFRSLAAWGQLAAL